MLPASFLAVAEESGLIVPIGALGPRPGPDGPRRRGSAEGRVPERFRLWVNVSPHQLANPHFADLVRETLDSHGIAARPGRLRDRGGRPAGRGATIKMLHALREQGLSINLDDFGAGHSNLSWLQDLPITGIKVDRRFVATLDVVGDSARHRHRAGTDQPGAFPGAVVVGEGVETSAQGDALRSMGCDLAQGYFFGYPGSAAQLWALATAGSAEASG